MTSIEGVLCFEAPLPGTATSELSRVLGLSGSVPNAKRQVQAGVDVVVAQGSEAGGHTGRISSLPLIPQTVDAVQPTPVLAAGGILEQGGPTALAGIAGGAAADTVLEEGHGVGGCEGLLELCAHGAIEREVTVDHGAKLFLRFEIEGRNGHGFSQRIPLVTTIVHKTDECHSCD